MIRDTYIRTRKKGSKLGRHVTRFPGIVQDAELLGVTRTHLYLVLTGQRGSASLMQRYRKLKRNQKSHSDTPGN